MHCRVGDLNEAVIALRLRVWMLRIRALNIGSGERSGRCGEVRSACAAGGSDYFDFNCQRSINSFAGCSGSSSRRACSAPDTGINFGSSRPTCTSSDA